MKRLYSYILDSSSAIIFICCLSLVLSAFFLPIPSYVLDILIAANIIISLTIVLNALTARGMEQFLIFPTLVFFVTIFRLALNLSSTRLILLDGDQGIDAAGEVIESFGQFVVGGDFIVGAVIFIIISVVNFFVVTKGSTRVAEVAARFTLDSLPGAQMAIEAELKSGNISKEEAQVKRNKLNIESKFYGSMDGAMKFVQGDAIAGLIIIFLNFVVGSALGVSRGLDVGQSISSFGILTVGDGLVSILPAFLVSISAGMVVTKITDSEDETSHYNHVQKFVADSTGTTIVASSLLLLLGIFTEFPFWPFALFLLLFVSVAYLKFQKQTAKNRNLNSGSPNSPELLNSSEIQGYLPLFSHKPKQQNSIISVRPASSMEVPPKIQLSVNPRAFEGENGFEDFIYFLEYFYLAYQKKFWDELGFKVPELTVCTDEQANDGFYTILVGNSKIEKMPILKDSNLVLVDSRFLNLMKIKYDTLEFDEILGTAGCWVESQDNSMEILKSMGFPILSFYEFLCLKLCFTSYNHLERVFGVQDIKEKYSRLKKDYPDLYKEVFEESKLSYSEIAELTRSLINQGINVSDIRSILESSSQYIAYEKPEVDDIDSRRAWLKGLANKLRSSFISALLEKISFGGDDLHVFSLSGEMEEVFVDILDEFKMGNNVVINFDADKELKKSVRDTFSSVKNIGRMPIVIVCSRAIRDIVEAYFRDTFNSKSWLYVISFDELPQNLNIKVISSF